MGHVIGLGIHMTLQAQEFPLPPQQEIPADASVRGVTGSAAFDFNYGMFVNEGAALLIVTIGASFPVSLL